MLLYQSRNEEVGPNKGWYNTEWPSRRDRGSRLIRINLYLCPNQRKWLQEMTKYQTDVYRSIFGSVESETYICHSNHTYTTANTSHLIFVFDNTLMNCRHGLTDQLVSWNFFDRLTSKSIFAVTKAYTVFLLESYYVGKGNKILIHNFQFSKGT